MTFHMVSIQEKPVEHLSLDDWHSRMDRIRHVADARRADTSAINNAARTTRNEMRIEKHWANYETNEALADRIRELKYWQDALSKTFERLEAEIEAMRIEQEEVEAELHAHGVPIVLIGQVLAMRDARLKPEMTHDEPDKELKNELFILENNQRLLAERLQAAWEKKVRLEAVRTKISLEIQYKVDTIDLESDLLALSRSSTQKSYKIEPLRNPRGCRTYQNWLEHTKSMKQMAECELADTAAIRLALFVSRNKAHQILVAQQDRADYTLRKRVFDTEHMVLELKWQQVKMKDAITKAICEIDNLEEDYRDKANGLKLAETRLDGRAGRLKNELCLDRVHDTLCLEASKIAEARMCLLNRVNEAKANLNLLSDHAKKIDEDLENKEDSLKLDKKAMELRLELKDITLQIKPYNPTVQTDRNFEITNMAKDFPNTETCS